MNKMKTAGGARTHKKGFSEELNKFFHLIVEFRRDKVHSSGWLGWQGATGYYATLPNDTGVVNLGHVSPGTHTLGL